MSYMSNLYSLPHPAAQHRPYQPFWPNYTLPPVVQYAEPASSAPPAYIAGTNMPAMPLGVIAADQLPLTSSVAKVYVDAAWPHLEPKVKKLAAESADQATIRAAIMAGGVALTVIVASFWIKKI
jgi:hypothetical protein